MQDTDWLCPPDPATIGADSRHHSPTVPITVTVPCANADASADFYTYLFSGAPDVRGGYAVVAVDDDVHFKLVERPAPIAPQEFAFNRCGIDALVERIGDAIPAHDGDVETMPPGTCWGPYEYPGGLALVVTDPDGHCLSFVEW